MSQSDLYDFFSYVARDGKSNTDTASASPAMARRTSIGSSSSSSDESSAPTPMSTTTRATPAPLMPPSRTSPSPLFPAPSSSSAAAAAAQKHPHRLTADEITARILASPEHHALCEMISGRHDHDDDYARRSADKYRAFVDLAARLEAQKMSAPPKSRPAPTAAAAATIRDQQQHDQARREWNSLWW
ncbi:uncharacterized protein PG986_012860 [Apiospora aurea]|uniref:Uncharacterized protein n=1 Tax=Apiospora aurea TaxID=335848 RepID=A0ABR1Q1V4_9PEZI